MLRYSDRSIFGTMESKPFIFAANPNNVSNVDQFNRVLNILFAKLKSQVASGGSLRKFATGENATSGQTIYALVQCTPDISQLDCSNCLDKGIGTFPDGSNRKEGGRFFGPRCNVRFETFPFVDQSTANEEPPPLSPPSIPPASSSPPPPTNSTATKGKKSNVSRTVVIAVVTTVASLIIIVCIYVFSRMRKPWENVKAGDEIISVESLQFDFGTIRVATNNFSDTNKLGQGGFGTVYKGRLSNGEDIAVKRLSMGSAQGEQEFKNAVLLVAKLQHRNLVRLLGFCLKENERLLIYEFFPNKSLNQFIFDMNPKISDFGTARLFLVDQTQDDTNRIVGTYGYMAPEYAFHRNFSVKSDVYSFGVLVLEIVSGQKNNSFHIGEDVEDLKSYAWKNWMEGTSSNLIDSTLRADSRTEIMRCIHIGLLCVQENVADRPTMASVILMLNSNSFNLPVPSRPAYYMYSGIIEQEMPLLLDQNSGPSESDQSQRTSTYLILNEASITQLNLQ